MPIFLGDDVQYTYMPFIGNRYILQPIFNLYDIKLYLSEFNLRTSFLWFLFRTSIGYVLNTGGKLFGKNWERLVTRREV
jgi:hypothetical protein